MAKAGEIARHPHRTLKVVSLHWRIAVPISSSSECLTLSDAPMLTRLDHPIPVDFSGIDPRASRMAGLVGDALNRVARDPMVIRR